MWKPVMIICLSVIWGLFIYYIICAIVNTRHEKTQ